MKTKLIFLVIAIFVLTTSFKTTYDWAQAWVEEKVLNKTELSWALRKDSKPKTLALILLTKKDLFVMKNGNKFLNCYLINNTDSTTLIRRADATINDFSSEIFKDNGWKEFQIAYPVTCGNSYWTQELASQKMLSIHYDHNEKGNIQVPFRLKFLHNKKAIYSNEIIVDIDQENFDRVGIKKKEKY
jgi:hypothetical protein